jgi:hypothetical protein
LLAANEEKSIRDLEKKSLAFELVDNEISSLVNFCNIIKTLNLLSNDLTNKNISQEKNASRLLRKLRLIN